MYGERQQQWRCDDDERYEKNSETNKRDKPRTASSNSTTDSNHRNMTSFKTTMESRLGGCLDTTNLVLVIDIVFIVTGGLLVVVWRRGQPRPQTARHDGTQV